MFSFRRRKKLFGARDWKVVQGFGVIKKPGRGTLLARSSSEYDYGDDKLDAVEHGMEFTKDIAPGKRLVVTLEYEGEELLVIGELQIPHWRNAIMKPNSGIGITEKVAAFDLEIGVHWRF